jgi:hypothetical protein
MKNWMAGFTVGCLLASGFFAIVVGTRRDAAERYKSCIELGAPAENCLKKYVLGEEPKP